MCNAAENGHLEVLKYLREEVKAPWDSGLPLGRLKMVIFTYSNILLSVSMINIADGRVSVRPENGHLDCLKYLHETAKAPWNDRAVRVRAREQPPRMCTIPPRQQLPITIWLAIRGRRGIFRIRIRIRIRRITSCNNTHTERDSIIAYLFFFSKMYLVVIPHKKQSPSYNNNFNNALSICSTLYLFSYTHHRSPAYHLRLLVLLRTIVSTDHRRHHHHHRKRATISREDFVYHHHHHHHQNNNKNNRRRYRKRISFTVREGK